MSKSLGKKVSIVPTDLGAISVTSEVIAGFDIEDIVKSKALSQALLVKMLMIGKDYKPQTITEDTITSVFSSSQEDLENG